MTYLLRRGKGSLRRRAHIATYDQYGNVGRAWCGRQNFNLTSNVPWGQPRCKDCIRAYNDGVPRATRDD